MCFPRNVNLPSQTPGEAGSHSLHARGQILSQHSGRCSVLDHLLHPGSGGALDPSTLSLHFSEGEEGFPGHKPLGQSINIQCLGYLGVT